MSAICVPLRSQTLHSEGPAGTVDLLFWILSHASRVCHVDTSGLEVGTH